MDGELLEKRTNNGVCVYDVAIDQCTFVENPSQSVRNYLETHLKAQDRALDSVVAAIEAWEFS